MFTGSAAPFLGLNIAETAELRLQLQELFGRAFAPGTNGVVGSVAPANESDVRKLLLCTAESGAPLVPQGAGTSPYGGSRASAGVAVTFERMNHILTIDEAAQLARVEPGVTWQQLIEHLRSRALMPRVYPSSAVVSTIGGFVAQGGIGVGSFQFGDVARNVQSVRLVTARGQALELRDSALELAIGAEGRTGLLVAITLRLQPLAIMEPVVATFNRVRDLDACLADVARSGVPLWSVSIMDRAAVDLQRRLGPGDLSLPQARYAALFSFRAEDRLRVLPKLRGCILGSGGMLLIAGGPHDTWIERFMGLQGLGTTPVPMQFRVPMSNLAKLIEALPRDRRRDLAFEGVASDVATAPCVALRFFLLEPPAGGGANYEIARELLLLAKQFGGKVYGTGAFFPDEAEDVFGPERLGKLAAFRRATDPADRLNPGKAFTIGA